MAVDVVCGFTLDDRLFPWPYRLEVLGNRILSPFPCKARNFTVFLRSSAICSLGLDPHGLMGTSISVFDPTLIKKTCFLSRYSFLWRPIRMLSLTTLLQLLFKNFGPIALVSSRSSSPQRHQFRTDRTVHPRFAGGFDPFWTLPQVVKSEEDSQVRQ